MDIAEVKNYMGKKVYYKMFGSKNFQEYILNAYIFRIHPKNKNQYIKQLELLDTRTNNSVLIVNMNDVKINKEEEKTNG